jgi:hypothetical protein
MISIPVAVNSPFFQWQLDLFWFNHQSVYNVGAYKKASAILIKRNHQNDNIINQFPWHIDIPNNICESFFDYNLGINYDGILLPLNIQVGLLQIIDKFDPNQLIELLDCDMFHLKEHPLIQVNDDEFLVSEIYENWHLKSLSENKKIIGNYTGNQTNYYLGGFVPIIGKAKTFKKILLDWIWIHKDIVRNNSNNSIKWWSGMFSFQAACEINKIKMIGKDFCHIPNVNELEKHHYIVHYSVDSLFDKKKFPNIDVSKFKNNLYYDKIKNWLIC